MTIRSMVLASVLFAGGDLREAACKALLAARCRCLDQLQAFGIRRKEGCRSSDPAPLPSAFLN